MDNLGAILLVLCLVSFLLFLLRVLLITCRSYTTSLRLKEEEPDIATATATNTTMASAAWNATTTAAAWNVTTTTTPYPVYLPDEGGYYYWNWYSGYVLYVLLILMFIVALPLAAILGAKRKREAAARSLALQRQRARRQMEIDVTTNSCNGGGATSGGVSNVCMNIQDEVSVLPKTLDLPPSYDEAAFSERKQGSTLTIATSLEASNPNLAVGINEPPPEYEANVAATSTTTTSSSSTTTTTTFLVNGQPPVM